MGRTSREQDAVSELLEVARATAAQGLNYSTTGNVSLRTPAGIYVSRSGSRCENLSAGDLVLMSAEGVVLSGGKPSSEWPFHKAIYAARDDVNAVVHCHSPAASVVACTGSNIPAAMHYMVFAHSAGLMQEIRCTPYEVPGSEALARETVEALGTGNVCLLGNHGQVAVGATAREALDHAVMLEHLCFLFASLNPGLPLRPIPSEKLAITASLFGSYRK